MLKKGEDRDVRAMCIRTHPHGLQQDRVASYDCSNQVILCWKEGGYSSSLESISFLYRRKRMISIVVVGT
jgi:hypothetical protein